MSYRFAFRFFRHEGFREETVRLTGLHYDDARTRAWEALSESTGERDVRDHWRLVSTMQEPVGALRVVES